MHDQLALVAFVFGEPAYGVAEDANVGRKVLREIRPSAERDLGALCSCDGGDLVVVRADEDAGVREQVRACALNWTVRDAEATRLHRNTITNIETGRYAGDIATLAAIASVLKRAGVEFIERPRGAAAQAAT